METEIDEEEKLGGKTPHVLEENLLETKLEDNVEDMETENDEEVKLWDKNPFGLKGEKRIWTQTIKTTNIIKKGRKV